MTDTSCIGLFNDSYPPILDGVTTALINYADYLHRHGCSTCIVTPANPVKAPAAEYPVMRYFSLPIMNRRPYRYGYPRLDFSIKRRLRRQPFRLIHSHSPFSAGRLAVYAARYHKVPLIGTFHSKYRTDLEHSLKHFPWIIRQTMKRILDFYNACDEVWIPQAAVEDTIREYGFKGRVVVVENGNDLATIPTDELPAFKLRCREKLGIGDPTTAVLLFVGQHIKEKGIDIILDAVRLLNKSGFTMQMHYVGDGYAADELRQAVRDAGLVNTVFIHGQVCDRTELTTLYAAADLFLFPSFYDNAPIVVKEAAALATPAVLLHDSTAAEIISDGVNGYLCNRTAESYADAIRAIMADRHSLSRVGMQARRSIARSWEDVMHEVTERYNDLCHDRH